MKNTIPHNYVRTERRRWALTQKELAGLLGFESRTSISRIEQGKCIPNLEKALALEIVFGIAPRIMFPQVFGETEERVMQHAKVLYEASEQSSKRGERRKCELLEAAVRRATAHMEV